MQKCREVQCSAGSAIYGRAAPAIATTNSANEGAQKNVETVPARGDLSRFSPMQLAAQ